MSANTKRFSEKISMELKKGDQQAIILEMVYGNPKHTESYVQFELKNKTFTSMKPMSKSDFCSIAQQGNLSPFYNTGNNSKQKKEFTFKNVDSPAPVPERQYVGCISVPATQNDGEIIIIETRGDRSIMTASRLANQRLKIGWVLNCSDEEVPEKLIVEFPRVREYSKIGNDTDNRVQTIMQDGDLMSLGSYDEKGDSFPIHGLKRRGSVIIPLNPEEHSSLIGVFYHLKCREVTPDYIVTMPEPKSESESEATTTSQ